MSYYKIIDVFSPKFFNNWEISKIVSRSVFFMLTLTWDTDILFEKFRPGTRGWIYVWKIPFSANMPLWVGISLKVCGLAAKEQKKAGGNCVCCLVTVVILFVGPGSRVKEVEDLMLSYGGKGKSYKQEELLWSTIKKLSRELTTHLLYLELPTSFSLLPCKKIYVLHKIPSY